MIKIAFYFTSAVFLIFLAPLSWAQDAGNASSLEHEIQQLKKTIADLEERLEAQENTAKSENEGAADTESIEDIQARIDELEERADEAEMQQALDRVRISGDYRFEAHGIWADVPAHFDGMALQNLVVKTMFAMPLLGRPPMSVDEINNTVSSNYADYLQFSNNITFDQLKQGMGSMPPEMQQQLFGLLMPSTYVPSYKANNDILYTNRLRLHFDANVAENISFSGRLSMYKVFGDSTGVQVFNGQPNTFNIDGTTTGVPNSDQIRVDRAYFSWNKIGGSDFYLSIGRRPSAGGPPMHYRHDEPRAGTPLGTVVDYQYDGITLGYNPSDNMAWRLCYGVGYESGFGNGSLIRMPQDRLKDAHLLGANIDFWNTDDTLIQATYAHAFDVTDGFNGLMVLPSNPLTGEAVPAPAVLRYTPSDNLGSINIFGVLVSRRQGSFDLFVSGNYSGTRPNDVTTPFGGLMSDPFETPEDRDGGMVLAGIRLNFPNNEATKLGFEFNHGSKYWFNFAHNQDDIIAPKTNTRGNVYEIYLTHRIHRNFIVKADYIRYDYNYSGSGWHVGAPKPLDSNPILGFPTYEKAQKASVSIIARF